MTPTTGNWPVIDEGGRIRPPRTPLDSIRAAVMAETTVAWPVSGDALARGRAAAKERGDEYVSIADIGDESPYASEDLEVSPDSRYLP